jgi:hypothetical protein
LKTTQEWRWMSLLVTILVFVFSSFLNLLFNISFLSTLKSSVWIYLSKKCTRRSGVHRERWGLHFETLLLGQSFIHSRQALIRSLLCVVLGRAYESSLPNERYSLHYFYFPPCRRHQRWTSFVLSGLLGDATEDIVEHLDENNRKLTKLKSKLNVCVFSRSHDNFIV